MIPEVYATVNVAPSAPMRISVLPSMLARPDYTPMAALAQMHNPSTGLRRALRLSSASKPQSGSSGHRARRPAFFTLDRCRRARDAGRRPETWPEPSRRGSRVEPSHYQGRQGQPKAAWAILWVRPKTCGYWFNLQGTPFWNLSLSRNNLHQVTANRSASLWHSGLFGDRLISPNRRCQKPLSNHRRISDHAVPPNY